MTSHSEEAPAPKKAAPKLTGRERAAEVKRHWDEHPGKGVDGAYRATVNGHKVTISRIEAGEDDVAAWIDIWTGGSLPSFRIVNPPTLIRDTRGDIEVEEPREDGKTHKQRYRYDPLAAVAGAMSRSRMPGGKAT